ncbi:cytochrome P450 [Aspergillus coremiiformis]|uniref:Cytochrome P450 n=1 Tax=Aspergillus coremiiformis TaxID=138285 RepID=A0A5N6ZBJ1_9EURO|nr:cytochrome P450 [Aspergillus coremiiformis]
MGTTQYVLLALAGWLSYHVLLAIYNVFFHPLRGYPGPKRYAASQLVNVYHIVKGDGCKRTAELHEQYGEVVRVGPNELSYISPSANRTIYGGRPRADEVFEKNPIANLQGTREVQNIFFAPHEPHARYKKLMGPAFSDLAVREQEPMIQQFVTQLVDSLRTTRDPPTRYYPTADRIVDLAAWYNLIIFDILSCLAFGQPIGGLEQAAYHPWVSAILKAIVNSTFIEAAHRLWPYHRLFERFVIPQEMKDDYASHLSFTAKSLAERQTRDHLGRADFASFILKGMSEEELFDNINIVVTAGGETTAATLTAATYYLTHNPRCYERLVTEIRETFSTQEDITLVALNELKYLSAVIKETLRIHPAVAIGLHRLTPKQGKVIDGKWVPGGTWVSVANLAACRTPRYWKHPDQFVPERWLADGGYAEDNHSASTPFSIGVRGCIGVNLANANMRLILARLLWSFDLEAQPDNVDPHELKEHGIWLGVPLKVKLHPRV